MVRRWIPVLLWGGIVLYASTNAGSSQNTGEAMHPILQWLFPDLPPMTATEINFFVRKTAHVVQFVIFAFLIWWGARLKPPLPLSGRALAARILIASVLVGGASEFIQIFNSLRGASFADFGLDVSGALVAVGIMLGWEAFRGAGTVRSSRVLITADLHLEDENADVTLSTLSAALRRSRAGVLLIAGDLAVGGVSRRIAGNLRSAVGGSVKVALVPGDQDVVTADSSRDSHPMTHAEGNSKSILHDAGIHWLEEENFSLPDLVICGGLESGGKPFQERLESALQSRRRVLVATHFPPCPLLEGNINNQMHVLDKKSQSSRFAIRLRECSSRVALLVCGHTGRATDLIKWQGVMCANVGGASGSPAFLCYDAARNRTVRILNATLHPVA